MAKSFGKDRGVIPQECQIPHILTGTIITIAYPVNLLKLRKYFNQYMLWWVLIFYLNLRGRKSYLLILVCTYVNPHSLKN